MEQDIHLNVKEKRWLYQGILFITFGIIGIIISTYIIFFQRSMYGILLGRFLYLPSLLLLIFGILAIGLKKRVHF